MKNTLETMIISRLLELINLVTSARLQCECRTLKCDNCRTLTLMAETFCDMVVEYGDKES